MNRLKTASPKNLSASDAIPVRAQYDLGYCHKTFIKSDSLLTGPIRKARDARPAYTKIVAHLLLSIPLACRPFWLTGMIHRATGKTRAGQG